MKKLGQLLLLLSVLGLFGCASQDVIVQDQNPYFRSPISLGEKPPELAIGSKYYFRKTNLITDEQIEFILIVKNRIVWAGSTFVYLLEQSRESGKGKEVLKEVDAYMLWDMNLNWVANLNKQGKVEASASPCKKLYDWPLKVGKTYNDGKVEQPDVIQIQEQVTVKTVAGAYRSFRIRRETADAVETHYYSPDIGLEVRVDVSNKLNNPAGPGTFSYELVKFVSRGQDGK